MSAPVFDAGSSAQSGGSSVSSLTFSHTCTGSNLALWVKAGWGGVSRTVSSVSYNGTDFAGAGAPSGQISGGRIEASVGLTMGADQWLLINPATGAHNIVVTLSAATGNWAAGGVSATGVNQTTPLGTAATNSAANDQTPSVDVTANSDDLVVAGCANISVGAPTTSEIQVWTKSESGTYGFAGAYQTGGGSPLTMDWAGGFSGFGFVATGDALKPVAGTAPRPVKMAGEWGGFASAGGGFAG